MSRPAAARVGRETSSFAENMPPVTLESRPRPLPSARARMASHTARITTSSARPPPNARGLNAPPSAPACAGCRRVSNVRGVRSRRVSVLPVGTSATLSMHCCSINEVGLYQRRAAVKGDVAQRAQQLQQLLPLVLLRARRQRHLAVVVVGLGRDVRPICTRQECEVGWGVEDTVAAAGGEGWEGGGTSPATISPCTSPCMRRAAAAAIGACAGSAASQTPSPGAERARLHSVEWEQEQENCFANCFEMLCSGARLQSEQGRRPVLDHRDHLQQQRALLLPEEEKSHH